MRHTISGEEPVYESADHEYEYLDNYKFNQPVTVVPPKVPSREPSEQQLGECELTQCPAYLPVAPSNQQAESSLMSPYVNDSSTQVVTPQSRSVTVEPQCPSPKPRKENLGDYELSQCPAYVPVTPSNQQAEFETSLMSPYVYDSSAQVETTTYTGGSESPDQQDGEKYEDMSGSNLI